MHRHGYALALDNGHEDDAVFLVSGGSDPLSVATAIAESFYLANDLVVRAVGASAVNQAVKAIAIARGHVATKGVDLVCRPGFINVEDFAQRRTITAMVFRLTLV